MSDLREAMERMRIDLVRRDSMLGRSTAHAVEPLVDHLQYCLVNLHDRVSALENLRTEAATDSFELKAAELLHLFQSVLPWDGLEPPQQDLATLVLEPRDAVPPPSPPQQQAGDDPRFLQERVLQRTRELVRTQRGTSHAGVNLWICLEEYVLRILTEDATRQKLAAP